MPRDGTKNLIPLPERSKEAQWAIRSAGGKASSEKARQNKKLREVVKAILGETIIDKNGNEVVIADAITLAQIKKALKGDTRAFKAIADVVDEKEQKIDMTSSDGSMSPLDIKVEFIKAKQE
jgi:hypothetical protein